MTQHPHPAAPQEVELKLATGPGALDALLAHPLLAEPPQQQALANTYFDTPRAIWPLAGSPFGCADWARACCKRSRPQAGRRRAIAS